jgi:hypothetical protein
MDIYFKNELEEIKSQVNCSKDFYCLNSGIENVCEVKTFISNDLILCGDRHPHTCSLSLPFGEEYFCVCAIRQKLFSYYGR